MRSLLRPSISRKFLLAFLALVLVGVANWLAVESTLSRLKGAATLTNLIGSIRWMSQRVQLDTLRVVRGRGDGAAVREVLDKLDTTLSAAMDGGSALGLDVAAPSPPRLRPSLQAIRGAAAEYRRHVQGLLAKVEAGRAEEDDFDRLYTEGNDLLAAADAVARVLSAEIAAIENNATASLYGLAGLDLAILLSLVFAIRTRIARPLRDLATASRQFAAGHYDRRVGFDSADEIGDLAKAFDHMAEEIQRDMGRIAADVVELERAQHSLRKLSQAVEHSPAAVVITDAQGVIEYVNPKFSEITRYGREEVVGRRINILKSGHTPDEVYADLWRTILSGQQWCGELLNRKKGGELFWEDTRISPITDEEGRITHFIAVKEDITERQRAAEELRVSKELFQATFDSASVGMALTDLAGRFLMVNGSLCETVGYPGDELLRKSLRDVVHGEDLALDADFIKEMIAGRRASYQIEKRCLHRRGYVVWVLLSVALVRGKDGSPLYFIGQFTDISARRMAEEQRRRIRDDLIESRERLRELVAHHDTVREQERKRIAMEIHDELGQMLTALKMDISLLRMRCEGDAELMAKVHDMREMVESGIRTVRQVAANLRPAALDLGLVPALEWLVENFGQHSGIAYELNLSGGDIAFDDVRATALFRIVQESLTNVARHAGASLAQVSLESTEDAIRLEIRDNGRGFDPEGVRRGRSFGLLGIRERTLVLGGELKIESAPGRGTTLSIRMPHTVCEQP